MRALPFAAALAVVCCCLASLPAQPARKLVVAVPRTPREVLASPRETLSSLYFAVVAYDYQPKLIEEAIACLDLDPATPATEAARLAIDLEQVLRTLCVPVHSLPAKPAGNTVVVSETAQYRISMVRGADGLWRFDRATVERIPAMCRASLDRFRELNPEKAKFREGYHDARATLRRFLSDTIARDFYSAARALDLGRVDQKERGEKGPVLARQLAFVMQRRGWLFLQEVPLESSAPMYTWHADRAGRIALECVRDEDGKQAWLFSRKTVRNIPAMYEQVVGLPADHRFVRIGTALPPLGDPSDTSLGKQPPASVPAYLRSPRALLQGFFRAMDAAETQDSRLADSLVFLDLKALPPADHAVQGAKLASKLEAVLRKIRIELSALPDDWNAPTQILGEGQGVRVEIVRQRDGCWRFSQGTVSQAQAFFEKLAVKDKVERASHLDSARDTMSTFLAAMRRGDHEHAAACLDLAKYRPTTREEIGPVLAYKLKFVMDRIGRVYIQEVPDTPDGPRYVFYRGELGRIVIARHTEGTEKGVWRFTSETVDRIGRMYRGVVNQPVNEASVDSAMPPPTFWDTPGVWVRMRVPAALRVRVWRMQVYQWAGLGLALLLCVLIPRLLLAPAHAIFSLILRKSGSALSRPFVAARLRPLTYVIAWWLLFQCLGILDLPVRILDMVLPLKTFGLACLLGWLGVNLVDLATGVYTDSELFRPHRSLSDMVVPVSMRTLKGGIMLIVAVYLIYQIGEGDALARFLTGLGVAGLAASLAAQDAMKGFFSTLLLIGERTFKIGDRITVGDREGVVEQVGFRATRLRTADGSLLTIPNATIASAAIDNLSTKTFNRCKASLLISADMTPEQVTALRDRLRAWLVAHPKVRNDKVEVTVNGLAGQGMEVSIDVVLAEVSPAEERELREEINCELLRQSESAKRGSGLRAA